MPKYDGTGPWGIGPRTGRRMGPCEGGYGWCRGTGMGYGRSWRMSKKDRREMLEDEANFLREDLQEIEKELEETKE